MSEFEFVLVTVTIVAGFAISEILAGWGRSLVPGVATRSSSLQLYASFILLFQTVRYIWTLWDLRSTEWLFSNFVLVLAPILTIALAAHVISLPASAEGIDAEQLYFARARPFYLLQVVIVVSWSLYDLALLPVLRDASPPSFLTTVFALRALGLLAFLWLAYTRRRGHHWVVLTGSLAGLIYLSIRALPALPQ